MKINPENLSLYAKPLARLFILVLTLINQFCTMAGYPLIPIENEAINDFVTGALTLISVFWCYWKNNSFTAPAVAADNLKMAIKGLATKKLYELLEIIEDENKEEK